MSGSWPHLATACLCTHKTVQVSGLVPRQQNTAKKILLSYIDNGGKVRMMVAVNVIIKLTLILLTVLIVQTFVNCAAEEDGLTCLAGRIPSSDITFRRCRTLTLVTNQTTFCNDDECRNYFSSAYDVCGLCNAFQLACNESEITNKNRSTPDLQCLFVEAAQEGLGACQSKRMEEGLTAYCLDESCSFVEEAYNKCGFDWHGCNPIRETCNKHFRSLLPLECNSGGNSNPAIVAIMILIMCSVLMI
ncbi:uncharacterized protein LOC135337070 [Halichondria panicea]|uniref:uncharacterized protein LOC135337070 n=1 Tax=Halichondria panicea TaxID=6063 RepID=UPI00312B7376